MFTAIVAGALRNRLLVLALAAALFDRHLSQASEREAAALRARGWRLHGLFVSADRALPPGVPAPDRAALDRLAAAGGGRTADLGAPEPVLDRVGGDLAGHLVAGGYGVLAFHDLGRWLLLLVLAPAAFLFRRSA